MGIRQTEGYDPEDTRETVAEFKQWADEHDCTLRPAFDWRRPLAFLLISQGAQST